MTKLMDLLLALMIALVSAALVVAVLVVARELRDRVWENPFQAPMSCEVSEPPVICTGVLP